VLDLPGYNDTRDVILSAMTTRAKRLGGCSPVSTSICQRASKSTWHPTSLSECLSVHWRFTRRPLLTPCIAVPRSIVSAPSDRTILAIPGPERAGRGRRGWRGNTRLHTGARDAAADEMTRPVAHDMCAFYVVPWGPRAARSGAIKHHL